MNEYERYLQALTRRHFLSRCGVGLGGIALSALSAGAKNGLGTPQRGTNPLAPRLPHHVPRAKNVIYLHMAGSPTQLELFDYKPTLKKHDGQACPRA